MDARAGKRDKLRRRRPRWLRLAVDLLLLGICVGFLRGCVAQQFFYPDRRTHSWARPEGRFEDVFFASGDGTRLHGWFVHAAGPAKGTVVHLHGNAQNITSHYGFVYWLPRQGYNVFAFDYRGYGRSEGSPSIEGVMADGLAAIEYVRGRTDVDKDRILVMGQSLGATIAATVVGRDQPEGVRGVVLDSAFSSFGGIVADKMRATVALYPFSFLSGALIGDEYSPDRYIAAISPRPVLLMHGTADRVVDVSHSRRLYELAGEPKELHLADGADHLEALDAEASKYRPLLLRFFEHCLSRNARAAE